MYIIGGKFKKRRLLVPSSKDVRPTTAQLREAFFNICQTYIEGASFLDLFAGSGAIGLEALSRGVSEVTFVEKSREALTCLKQNIQTLDVDDSSHLLAMDALKALGLLEKHSKQFDIIYADPPYGRKLGAEIVKWVDQHQLLKPQGFLFVEESDLKTEELQKLTLVKERSWGRSKLYQFLLG